MDIQDKVVVVTGASRGIGAGIARVFQRQGMKIALCARSESPPEGVELQPGRALYRPVDVQDPDAVEAFAAAAESELGPLDLWINNAGVLAPIGMTRDVDPAAWRSLIGINVMGVYHGARAFLNRLHAADRAGCLINIGSGASRGAYAGWGAYCASKAAVDHLTRVLVEEEKGTGSRIYTLAPGIIETAMQEHIRAQNADDFPMVEKFRKMRDDGVLLDVESPAEIMLDLAFGEERAFADPCVDVRDLRD